jgi:hypothetical protein
MEHHGGAEIADLTCFAGYVDPTRGSLGFCNGLWDVGPWVYPCLGLFVRNCKSINKIRLYGRNR